MPAPVVPGERMKFVDDDDSDVLEEMPMVDLGGNQDDFERFRRRQQAVGRIGDDPPLLRLGRIAVPAGALAGRPAGSSEPVVPAGCSGGHGSG